MVIGNDTVIAFTPAQRTAILKTYELVDHLQRRIAIYQSTDSANTAIIDSLQNIVCEYQALITEYKASLALDKLATDALLAEVNLWKRRHRLTKIKWIATSVGTASATGGLGFLIGYIYAKHDNR